MAMWLSVRAVYQEGAVNFNCVSYFSPGYAVLTMVSILFLYGVAEWLARWRAVQRVCGFVGKHSYEAYLAHVLVLTRCSRFLLEHWPYMNRYVFYGVLTVCTILGAVLIAWAVGQSGSDSTSWNSENPRSSQNVILHRKRSLYATAFILPAFPACKSMIYCWYD